MSGKKQHYIPKTLLKGFRISANSRQEQAFVFKSGRSPYIASINDIAAQRYFYSDLGESGSTTVDDRITEYENRLAPLLRNLQSTADGQSVDPLVSAEVVAHLSIRGAYLRELFSSGMQQLIRGSASGWGNLDSARMMLSVDELDNTTYLIESIDKEIDKIRHLLPSNLPVPLLRRFLLHFVREDFDDLYKQTLPVISSALKQLFSQVPGVIRNGHASIFNSSMAPDSRVFDLATLSWSVRHSKSALILPDCVAVSINKTSAAMQPYLMERVQDIGAIILPLSANQMLVGCRPDTRKIDETFDFNRHAASCSTNFFVSPEDSDVLRTLANGIGRTTHGTISSLVSEALDKMYRQVGSPSALEGRAVSPEDGTSKGPPKPASAQPPGPLSYRVSFRDCATQEQAEVIAKAVGVVVNHLAPYLELEHLSAIIFADDYPSALRELDAALTEPVNLKTIELDGLVGVASTANEYVDGRLRSYIVMRSSIGQMFMLDDEDGLQVATHMLSMMLSQISFSALQHSAFGEAKARPPYSPWELLLYAPMSAAPAGYYAAWMSAGIDPSAENAYREILLKLFDHANDLIGRERFSYEDHNDLDRFIQQVTEVLGDVLITLAKLIGHCDASNSSIYGDDDELKDSFERQNLVQWVSLYSRDLRQVFASRGQWGSEKLVRSLGAHMERHLWRYFLFPWVMDDGRVWIEVPKMGDHRFG